MRREADEPGIGDHQDEGQEQHARRIMRIEPASLALAEPQQKEIGEDFLVRDDAAENRDQHRPRRDADQPARGIPIDILKVEVEAVEEPAAQRLARAEEHTSELQSLMRISYALLCLQNKKKNKI